MNNMYLFVGNNRTLAPSLIIWDVNFSTDDDNPYFISFIPEETKADLAHEYLGIDLPKESEQEDFLFLTSDGFQYCVSSWKNFLNTAYDYQIDDAVSYMEDLAYSF